jgi:hypothetical protein
MPNACEVTAAKQYSWVYPKHTVTYMNTLTIRQVKVYERKYLEIRFYWQETQTALR